MNWEAKARLARVSKFWNKKKKKTQLIKALLAGNWTVTTQEFSSRSALLYQQSSNRMTVTEEAGGPQVSHCHDICSVSARTTTDTAPSCCSLPFHGNVYWSQVAGSPSSHWECRSHVPLVLPPPLEERLQPHWLPNSAGASPLCTGKVNHRQHLWVHQTSQKGCKSSTPVEWQAPYTTAGQVHHTAAAASPREMLST